MPQIVHKSLHADAVIPTGTSLTSFVFGRALRFGDKTAAIDSVSGEERCFGGLWRRVQGVGLSLQKRGLKKGTTLAIWAPNSMGWIIAFHGTIAAGGIVTTLNPAYTAAEAARQLENSGAEFLVTTKDFLPRVEQVKKEYQNLKDVFIIGETPSGYTNLMDLHRGGSPTPVHIDAKNDVCVLPYSSGTTGVPKGTMLTHDNVVANLCQMVHPGYMNPHGAFTPDDTLLGVLPFYHIYGMVVIMNASLICGSRLIIMPGFEPVSYLKLLKKYDVTVAHVAPPLVQFLAKSPIVPEYGPFPRLRELFSGAAPLGKELTIEANARLGSHVVIRQGYGMTETSPVSHADSCTGVTLGSIGYLAPSMESRIVNPDTGIDQPVGTEKDRGELWLRGPNIMKGYHRNEASTKGTIDGDGWLHTGDVAYVNDKGCYFIVDRLKELIKVKGFQVAPAELEALLVKHPQVADAAVIGVPAEKYGGREGDGEAPKAFVVLQPKSTISPKDLSEWLSPQVTSYKQLRPALIEFVPSVPKSASGKILRKDLRVAEAKKLKARM